VANSVALRLAGITRETKDPPAGTIDRNPDGTPTGVLKEDAQGLVTRLIPRATAADEERGIRELVKGFNAEGMTGVKDPGISAQSWAAYQRVLADSALSVRVFALWSGGSSVEDARRVIASAPRRRARTRARGPPPDQRRREAVHGRLRRRAHGVGCMTSGTGT